MTICVLQLRYRDLPTPRPFVSTLVPNPDLKELEAQHAPRTSCTSSRTARYLRYRPSSRRTTAHRALSPRTARTPARAAAGTHLHAHLSSSQERAAGCSARGSRRCSRTPARSTSRGPPRVEPCERAHAHLSVDPSSRSVVERVPAMVLENDCEPTQNESFR